jgi:uroporphyrinogen decarboxylase
VGALRILDHLRRGALPPIRDVPEPLLDGMAALASLRGRVSTLTPLERVIASFRNREPDRVPVTPILCAAARQITGASFPEFAQNADTAAEAFLAGLDFVGGDLLVLMLDLSVEAADFGQQMVYPEASTPVPHYQRPRIRDVSDYAALERIDWARAPRMREFVRLCRLVAGRVGLRAVASGFVFGPLGVLNMMRGAESLFTDCLRHPGEVRKACETITSVLLEFVQAQCETGVVAMTIDTLFASQNGVPKEVWEQVEGPFVREISRLVKKNGLLVAVHNCGHAPYFDAQIRFMEPEAVSFAHLPDDCANDLELKQRYGDRVTLIGYVSTPLLAHGSPQEVMDACRRQIEILGKGGGYVLAPGCEYPPNMPLTNAFAMVRAAQG